MSRQFLYCSKRERDNSIKPIFSGGKTTFRGTPALNKNVDISQQLFSAKAYFFFHLHLRSISFLFLTIIGIQLDVLLFGLEKVGLF